MKRILALLLTALLLASAACAEGEFVYSTASVTTCEQTSPIYDAFYASGELSVSIPGVAEGIVPQGICYLPEEDWMLFAGYRTDKDNSALIAVDMKTNQVVKEVLLNNVDGSAYNGHAGGVCVTEKNIFVSNNHRLYRLSLETFRGLPASGYCAFEEEIPVPVNSSYCCYNDGILWVGEFQYGSEYKTDSSHRLKGEDGYHRAWTCGYVLDSSTENEFTAAHLTGGDAVPDYILSMTERIQGIAVNENGIYLSQSYGRRNSSHVYRYANVLLSEPAALAEVEGAEVPVWLLDSSVLTGELLCPPMSECMAATDSGLYLLFESAAETYIDPSNPSQNPMDRVFRITDF